MTFIPRDEVKRALRELGPQQVLAKYGRYRIAPGFTVADYVKIGEFYMSAGENLSHEGRHEGVRHLVAR